MVRIVNLGLMITYVKLVMKTKGRYIWHTRTVTWVGIASISHE